MTEPYFCPTVERDVCSIDCDLWKECPTSTYKNINIPKPSDFDLKHNVRCKISTVLPDGTIVKRTVW